MIHLIIISILINKYGNAHTYKQGSTVKKNWFFVYDEHVHIYNIFLYAPKNITNLYMYPNITVLNASLQNIIYYQNQAQQNNK